MFKKILYFLLVLSVAKLSGFLRDIILSYQFGASNISDAYLVSLTIPGSIFAFLGIAIKAVYIPSYIKNETEYGTKAAYIYTQKLTTALCVISAILIVLGVVFARPIVYLYASGFDKETADICVFLTRLNLLTLVLLSIEYVNEALLQAKGQYAISEFNALPANIIIIISFYCVTSFGVVFFSVGKILSVVLQLLITFVYLYFKFNYTFKFHSDLKSIYRDKEIKGSLKNVVPVVLSTSGNEINKIVDRSIASSISVGGISSLVYANRLNALINEICINSIITIQYPRISECVSKNKIDELKIEVANSLLYMFFFLMPATAVMLLFSKEIITFVYGHGNGISAINYASAVFFYYSFGVIAVGIREVIIRVFYSMGNTKTPALIALIGISINIFLDFLLTHYIGFGGLALATSISSIMVMSIDYLLLKKRIPGLLNELKLIDVCKLFFSTIIISFFAVYIYNKLTGISNDSVSLLLSIILSGALYIVLLIVMKSPVVSGVKNIVKKIKIK